jgi:hypothetical protein
MKDDGLVMEEEQIRDPRGDRPTHRGGADDYQDTPAERPAPLGIGRRLDTLDLDDRVARMMLHSPPSPLEDPEFVGCK